MSTLATNPKSSNRRFEKGRWMSNVLTASQKWTENQEMIENFGNDETAFGRRLNIRNWPKLILASYICSQLFSFLFWQVTSVQWSIMISIMDQHQCSEWGQSCIMLQRRLWRHSSSSLPSEDDEEVDGVDDDDEEEEEEHEDEDKDDNHAAEAPLTSLFSSSAISRWMMMRLLIYRADDEYYEEVNLSIMRK